jgi:Flp pilus assembly protein protease CpaA
VVVVVVVVVVGGVVVMVGLQLSRKNNYEYIKKYSK